MFVNMASGQRGLVCQYDVVCFDEITGVSFDQKDGVNLMKGYMESGEFSRGKESIRANGGIVMVGNFDVDVQHQQRIGHLFSPLPAEMRNDTALMDRIHSYLPGWDVPKISNSQLTEHFGLVSDFLSECWSQLRSQSRVPVLMGRVLFGGALSGRDNTAVQRTISGLLKLIHPSPEEPVPDESLEWAVRLALECRRRVKEQQKRVGAAEFRNTHFSYQMYEEGVEKFVVTPELQSEDHVGSDPLPPGQVWGISPGGLDENPGLYRIEVNEGPGSGVKILNRPAPQPFTESVRYAEQNLYARSKELVGDRDPREHEFSVQLRAFDSSRSGSALGIPVLLALCGALLQKSLRGGLAVVGGLNLGGSVDPVYNAVSVAELAIEKGATSLLIPVSARKQMNELSDEMVTKINIQYFTESRDALIKSLAD
jgi:ATP-dependent Lon protease